MLYWNEEHPDGILTKRYQQPLTLYLQNGAAKCFVSMDNHDVYLNLILTIQTMCVYMHVSNIVGRRYRVNQVALLFLFRFI